MPSFNLLALLISALVPLVVGGFWYAPKVMGNAISNEVHGQSTNLRHHPMVFVATFIFSFMISMLIAAILSTHAVEDQNMQHGAFHGLAAAVFMGVPSFAIIAMFEFKSIKYLTIHALYLMVSFAIMGAIIGGM
jgi:surface polysaccharide O-acyltransferase-like enzyme